MKTQTKLVNVLMKPELYEDLKREAEKRSMTVAGYIKSKLFVEAQTNT